MADEDYDGDGYAIRWGYGGPGGGNRILCKAKNCLTLIEMNHCLPPPPYANV